MTVVIIVVVVVVLVVAVAVAVVVAVIVVVAVVVVVVVAVVADVVVVAAVAVVVVVFSVVQHGLSGPRAQQRRPWRPFLVAVLSCQVGLCCHCPLGSRGRDVGALCCVFLAKLSPPVRAAFWEDLFWVRVGVLGEVAV